MPVLCPLCARDDSTTEGATADGVRFVVCTDSDHGDEPYEWEIPQPPGRRATADGIGGELGVWDKLLECIMTGEAAVPYGVVEDRFFERFPDESQRLLREYGHKWRDPEHPSTQFSMSAYLAGRLSELASEGALEKSFGRAEGEWKHNEVISWWRRV